MLRSARGGVENGSGAEVTFSRPLAGASGVDLVALERMQIRKDLGWKTSGKSGRCCHRPD